MAKKAKGKGKGKKGGKKAGGAKTPTLVDGVSAEEMTPEQLIEHIGRLKEEVRVYNVLLLYLDVKLIVGTRARRTKLLPA